MEEKTKQLELLAPAGDVDCFKIAVASGANAIYLGLPEFNARMKAHNFDYDQLKECVEYAHFYNVKVYVTLNTLVSNSEMYDAMVAAGKAVAIGVDAFIVQDLGIVGILKRLYKDIEIHLSTQAGVHNLAGAKVAEQLGVSRVVLSRETTLKDIKEIRANTNLDIEYFVQGALCVCFSGNCYLSSQEYGMSGNRGLCKQLCRLPYSYTLGGQTEKGYMLSAKDLCLLKNMKELIDAGVTSFKIEGRMRRTTYVAEAVTTYRKALDNFLDKKDLDFLYKKLKIQYNREYLDRAYLDGKVIPVINPKTPNHIGIEIGTVIAVKPFKNIYSILIKSDVEINRGDGLKFFNKGKEIASLGVGTVNNKGKGIYEIITGAKVQPQMKVNLIDDSRRAEVLLNKKPERIVDLKIKAHVGENLKVWAKSEDIEEYFEMDGPLSEAQTSPMTRDNFVDNFSKVAESGFTLGRIDVDLENVFISRKILNEFRRAMYESLRVKCVNSRTIIKEKSQCFDKVMNMLKTSNNGFNPLVLEDKVSNSALAPQKLTRMEYVYMDSLRVNLDKETLAVIVPENYNERTILQMVDMLLGHKNIALLLPSIANSEDILYIDELLDKLGNKINSLVIDNLYGFRYRNKGYNLYAGQGLNVYNNYSAYMYISLGVLGVQPSIEIHASDISVGSMEISSYKLPLMTFTHCPYQTMTGCTCETCKYKKGLTLRGDRANFEISRYRLTRCYFKLYKN